MPRRPSTASPAANKLNIYLIKKGRTSFDSIVKEAIRQNKITLSPRAVFYYNASHPGQPDWIASFFLNNQRIPASQFIVSGTSAVLVCKITITSSYRYFAICFGGGHHHIEENAIEDRFGLITTLNIVSPNQLRSIDKRVVASNPKLSREQLAKVGTATDFGIDIEHDLLHGVTGRPNIDTFGKTVTGKDGFSCSARANIDNIDSLLQDLYRHYKKQDYKTSFPWIDQLKEVKDTAMLQTLNDKLIDLIKTTPDEVSLAVPDIIEWSEVVGFKYSYRKRDEANDELSIQDFLAKANLDNPITLDNLQDTPVTCWVADDDTWKHKWNAYQCVNAEIRIRQKLYILSNGKWYDIALDFVQSVHQTVSTIPAANITPLSYAHASEAAYNQALTTQLHGLCMDADNIQYGQGMSKIEFCDVLAPGKKILHVKKYGGSSVLSHLFSQGYVSAELLLQDPNFRKAVRAKLPSGPFKNMVPTARLTASEYKIVYVIIGKTDASGKITLPFFSQVTLRRHFLQLSSYNYKVFLNFVSTA